MTRILYERRQITAANVRCPTPSINAGAHRAQGGVKGGVAAERKLGHP